MPLVALYPPHGRGLRSWGVSLGKPQATLEPATVSRSAAFLKAHGCTRIAMPEPWGEGGVDRFEAEAFVGMLEESVRT